MLPSNQSIDLQSQNSNLAHSLTQFRKTSEDSRTRGKVIGSERFDMRGNPMSNDNRSNYKAQYQNSPFKQGNMKMNMTSPSTSLGKFTFNRNNQINMEDGNRTEIVSKIISVENGGGIRKSRGSSFNQFSMQEIRDLDTSPEKR